jgi:hypothetical protein
MIQPRGFSGIRIAANLIGVIAVLYIARDILIPLRGLARIARPNRTIRLAISGLPRDAGGS